MPLRMVSGAAPSSPANTGDGGPGAAPGHAVPDDVETAVREEPRNDEGGGQRERALLGAWREAHWALRLRLRDLMGMNGASEVERLYDLTRRADNQLNDFYRSRAEEVTRRLRDAIVEQAPPPPTCGDRAMPRFTPQASSVLATIAASATRPSSSERPGPQSTTARMAAIGHDLTINERALLNRFRVMEADDRAALLRVAQRFAESTERFR